MRRVGPYNKHYQHLSNKHYQHLHEQQALSAPGLRRTAPISCTLAAQLIDFTVVLLTFISCFYLQLLLVCAHKLN